MRPSLAVVVISCCANLPGCLRAGFEAPLATDAGGRDHDTLVTDGHHVDATPIPPNAVFISPTGDDDANPGTAAAPWRTWSHALSQLSPGDALVALPGVYGAASKTGYLRADCADTGTWCDGGPCSNGEATRPITVMAYRERAAFLKAELNADRPMDIRNCRHWRIIGLRVENTDDPNSSMGGGFPVQVNHCREVTLRRMLAGCPNRYFNTKVFHITYSTDILVEECEAYHFHRSGFLAAYSDKIVFRRNYANGRFATNIPNGYGGSCGNPEIKSASTGISVYDTNSSIVENNVVENVCHGISVSRGHGDNNILSSNMVVGVFMFGFLMSSPCAGQDPCVDEERIVRGNSFAHNVVVGGYTGHYFRGTVGTTLSHVSVLGHQKTGFQFDLSPDNKGLAASIQVTASLAASTSADRGFVVMDHQSWSITYSNAHGNTTNFLPDTTEPTNGSYDPLLGGCYVYIPAGSPAKGAGPGGSDIGANIIFRSENGTLTGTKLWDPVTGQFPCGATITGVNDDASFPGSTCASVHHRLHVGTSGCPVP